MAEAVKQTRAYRASLRQEQADLTRRRIMQAGRRLLAKGTYSAVTMREVAAEAGVAYQTVYAIFGNKLRLAQAIVEDGWPHVAEALSLVEEGRRSEDPRVWMQVAARISRRINELCADLPRFMRESGDPVLRGRYSSGEHDRYQQLEEVSTFLERTGKLRQGLTASEAHAILWGLTGPDWYCLLVFERGWEPARYEEWLAQALIELLLEPQPPPGASSPASV